ncbi:MAG: hypothetical protein ABI334_02120 [Candidatus Dormiibacterota bacterium]
MMQPGSPSALMVYIGTKDADETAKKVEAAGGKVIAAPFDVPKSGRMAAFSGPVRGIHLGLGAQPGRNAEAPRLAGHEAPLAA